MHLLIVDDDHDDFELFCEAAKSVHPDAKCVYAFNGREALKRLDTATDLPNYIVLDVIMPVLDGEQFIRQIKETERLREIPIIIYSSASNFIDIPSLKKLGAEDYINKPIEFHELVQRLKEILK